MERNHRLELQYDGAGLHGWAKQDGLLTVEGSLRRALGTVLGVAPDLQVAGRTDAGVHARRQIVSLALPAGTDVGRLRASLNALTPPGIAITRIVPAPAGFDARKDAVSRTYRYFLANSEVVSPFLNRYCWHVPEELDLAAVGAAAEATVGRHDFKAFTPAETEHVFFNRLVLRCAWKPARGVEPGMFHLEIEAEAFLRHMVRTLVGTMVEIGLGKRNQEDFRGLLAGAPRTAAGPTAPAQGLFLWDVRYRATRRQGVSDAVMEGGPHAE
ncbi:MAG: tRNA pseudouridine(38-40) synthase TruA [Thermoleophilia bacterium]|nr:tRNA pseudouridine(38-40) synthase TruA [Thermoleophilia bacterium]